MRFKYIVENESLSFESIHPFNQYSSFSLLLSLESCQRLLESRFCMPLYTEAETLQTFVMIYYETICHNHLYTKRLI